jgi:hypothetical protein
MKGKPKKGKAGGRVLTGHKRVGNRLKPEFLTKMNFQFVSYVDQTLPEIVLLGLLNDGLGYSRGAELSLLFAEALRACRESAVPLISDLACLTSNEVASVALRLKEAGALEEVRAAFTPFILLCPEHPLAGIDPVDMPQDLAMEHLKTCVGRLYDRNATPACAAMANLYYVQACGGRLHIANGMRVPSLEAITARPESEDARHASASVRMFAQSLVGQVLQERPAHWPDVFWNRCYQVSDCDFMEYEDE